MGTKHFLLIGAAIAILAAVFVIFNNWSASNSPGGGAQEACTREAKICPDGSTVGREGPHCEFAACPDIEPAPSEIPAGTKVTVTARVGQSVEVLGETLIIRKVVEDSRCPQDVQCVWAGTVKLDATIRGGMGDGQVTIELGKEATSEVNSFLLTEVSPAPKSTNEISGSDYVFTFIVERRG